MHHSIQINWLGFFFFPKKLLIQIDLHTKFTFYQTLQIRRRLIQHNSCVHVFSYCQVSSQIPCADPEIFSRGGEKRGEGSEE